MLVHQLARKFFQTGTINKTGFNKAIAIDLNELSKKLIGELEKKSLWGIDCLGYFDDRSLERVGDRDISEGYSLLGRIRRCR